MRALLAGAGFALAFATGCAGKQPPGSAGNDGQHTAPGKCSACHLAPKEHSLPADRWQRYLENHRRRIRLTDGERLFLRDFLVGEPLPAAVGP